MGDLSHYDRDDPTFVRDLLQSEQHVDIVARWLYGSGYNPVVPPISVRDDPNNMRAFADGGDIFVGQSRIECKQRGLRFTCARDFPYRTIIVDVAHAWDNANPKPHLYVLTDVPIVHCVVVRSKTSTRWIRTQKRDWQKRRDRCFYECPIVHCEFYAMHHETIKL